MRVDLPDLADHPFVYTSVSSAQAGLNASSNIPKRHTFRELLALALVPFLERSGGVAHSQDRVI